MTNLLLINLYQPILLLHLHPIFQTIMLTLLLNILYLLFHTLHLLSHVLYLNIIISLLLLNLPILFTILYLLLQFDLYLFNSTNLHTNLLQPKIVLTIKLVLNIPTLTNQTIHYPYSILNIPYFMNQFSTYPSSTPSIKLIYYSCNYSTLTTSQSLLNYAITFISIPTITS